MLPGLRSGVEYVHPEVGKAKYSILVNDKGGVIDDLITYRLGDEEFMVVPNASNIDTDFAAMSERLGDFKVEFVNESDQTSLIAVQGLVLRRFCWCWRL